MVRTSRARKFPKENGMPHTQLNGTYVVCMKIPKRNRKAPHLVVEMVRMLCAQKFPIQIGKSPHLVVVPELPHVHSHPHAHEKR